MSYVSLHDRLRGSMRRELQEELHIGNVHALPRIEKVIVNVGINRTHMEGKEMIELVTQTLQTITGQKPVLRKSRKAISNFKIREGQVVGAMVTLRGRRMEEFLDRLVSYVLPRIRDFRGLSTKMDGRGNYAIGLRDQTVFPEVPAGDILKIFGLQIQITTTAETDEAARLLLKKIGFPFRPERKEVVANA